MLPRMLAYRTVAATDMSARQAHAKLCPLHAKGETLLAAVGVRSDLPDLAEMFAGVGHVIPHRIADRAVFVRTVLGLRFKGNLLYLR